MAVIINDFEILMEPRPADNRSPDGATTERAAPSAPPMRPEDIERIVHHFEQRRRRVAAD